MKNSISINNQLILPGTKSIINLNISRLISGTKIDLPIYVYRSKINGPVVLLSGGLHGDEVNGIEIIRRLIHQKTFNRLNCGTVIAIPIMNIYGFLNFSREVPDGKDVNRSFPGNKNGSLASRVAYNLTNNVLQAIDFGIDFHTGGANRSNYPQCRFAEGDQKSEALAKIFNAPIRLHSRLIDKSIRKQAYKMGKSILVYEGGESMRFDEAAIWEGMRGAKRVLAHQGMIDFQEEMQNSIFCTSSSWVRAKRSGLIRLLKASGDEVKKKDVLASITDPYNNKTSQIKAPFDGIIIGHNNTPLVNQGDALFHIAFR